MTSEERKEARYLRRVKRREEKRLAMARECDDFDRVFTYDHLYSAYRNARKNVAWKASVQRYMTQAPLYVSQTLGRLLDGTFRSDGFFEFDLSERGKTRHIKSVTMAERVVQRCLCDNALVPMLSRTFVYDNGASLHRKGYHFTVRRLMRNLRRHIWENGTEGYILLFDFSKFFDNVSHELIRSIMDGTFHDERIKGLCSHFVDAFGDVGLGLGSQVSQILALASANRLDHYIKEVLRIKCYGRYMDDGYLIHRDKGYLQRCLDGIRHICEKLHIRLNEKKTQIVKLSHGFSWMKMRIRILSGGKIIRKMRRDSAGRMRRKLKSYRRMVNAGILCREDVLASFQSWRAYAMNFNSYRTIRDIEKRIAVLFPG